jgi:hypothetical protein
MPVRDCTRYACISRLSLSALNTVHKLPNYFTQYTQYVPIAIFDLSLCAGGNYSVVFLLLIIVKGGNPELFDESSILLRARDFSFRHRIQN